MTTYKRDENIEEIYIKLKAICNKIIGLNKSYGEITIHTNEDLTTIEKTNIETELGYKIKRSDINV